MRFALLLLGWLAASSALAQAVAHYDVYADGDTVHLLVGYGQKGEPAIALYHRRSSDAGATWSAPVRVNRDSDRLSAHHPGENPQIAAAGDRVIVTWTAPRAGQRRGGLIATALSADGGKTWQPGRAPFPDAAGAQTFTELVAAGKTLHMVWLDSRDRAQSLRYAQSGDAGATWSADRPLAPRTCDCCWNSMAVAPDGMISVLFRGEDPRDMMHVSSKDGSAWRHSGSVGGFNWRVNGCPHVGGAIAATGSTLHTLVWTGKEEQAGLYYSSSADGGAAWSRPKPMGGDGARNADLAAAPDGTLVAVWDEFSGRSGALFVARSKDGGTSWSAPERIASGNPTLPRVAATRQGTVTVWLEGSPWKGGKLRVNGKDLSAPQ